MLIHLNQHSEIYFKQSFKSLWWNSLCFCGSVHRIKVHGFVYPDKWYDHSYHLFSTFYFLFTYYPIEQECVTKQYRISTLKKNHFKIFRVNVAVFKSRILHHSNNLQAVSSCTTSPSGNYCPFPWYITLYSYSYHNPNSFFVPLKLHLSLVSF